MTGFSKSVSKKDLAIELLREANDHIFKATFYILNYCEIEQGTESDLEENLDTIFDRLEEEIEKIESGDYE